MIYDMISIVARCDAATDENDACRHETLGCGYAEAAWPRDVTGIVIRASVADGFRNAEGWQGGLSEEDMKKVTASSLLIGQSLF